MNNEELLQQLLHEMKSMKKQLNEVSKAVAENQAIRELRDVQQEEEVTNHIQPNKAPEIHQVHSEREVSVLSDTEPTESMPAIPEVTKQSSSPAHEEHMSVMEEDGPDHLDEQIQTANTSERTLDHTPVEDHEESFVSSGHSIHEGADPQSLLNENELEEVLTEEDIYLIDESGTGSQANTNTYDNYSSQGHYHNTYTHNQPQMAPEMRL